MPGITMELRSSAIAEFVGNVFLVAGNADIYEGNMKAIESLQFLILAELREFVLIE